MAIFLVGTALALGKVRTVSTIGARPLVFIGLSGLAGALSWLCYFVALGDGPATGVAALDRSSVAIVFVLAFAFVGEALTWQGALGAALVVVGAILLT